MHVLICSVFAVVFDCHVDVDNMHRHSALYELLLLLLYYFYHYVAIAKDPSVPY